MNAISKSRIIGAVDWLWNQLEAFAQRRRLAILVCGLFGALIPALIGWTRGPDEPYFTDEMCYVFGAETFRAGQLSAESPPVPEAFASAHVLVRPRYVSKYLPGNSLLYALGWTIFGVMQGGPWLASGVASASLCWMLQQWTRPRWALLGTIFFLLALVIPVDSDWAHRFWRGMVSFAGGALFFGGVRKLYRRPSVVASLFMGLGLVILGYTRPVGGIVIGIYTLPVFLVGLWKTRHQGWKTLVAKCLPAGLVVGAGVAFLLYFNAQVMGHPLEFPYRVYHERYVRVPLTIFNEDRATGATFALPDDHRTIKFLSTFWQYSLYHYPASYQWKRPLEVIETQQKVFLPHFLIVTLFGLLFLTRQFWVWWAMSAIIVLTLLHSITSNYHNHYSAPTGCLWYFLAVFGFRNFMHGGWTRRLKLRLYARYGALFIVVVVLISEISAGVSMYKQGSFYRTPTYRTEVESLLNTTPGKHLVLVRCEDPEVHREWVYNHVNWKTSKVMFAHDLGDQTNQRLMRAFPDRNFWWVQVHDRSITLLERWSPDHDPQEGPSSQRPGQGTNWLDSFLSFGIGDP